MILQWERCTLAKSVGAHIKFYLHSPFVNQMQDRTKEAIYQIKDSIEEGSKKFDKDIGSKDEERNFVKNRS